MELKKGQAIATLLIKRLRPYCRRIEVAGSIRRKRPVVHDIDLVLVPSDLWQLNAELKKLGEVKKDGDKYKTLVIHGAQVDVYFATEETWATLYLVKTGSKESNIRLAARAKKMGLQLKANGDGLVDREDRRIAGESEASIFQALDMPYLPPEKRN